MNAITEMNPADRLAEVEVEKIQLEIEQLKRPTYKKVAFWTGIVIPIVALAASLLTGVLTGFFDDQLTSLKVQKEQLQDQLQNATTTETYLSEKNSRLENDIELHQMMVERLEAQARQLDSDATAATEGLETVFIDLNELLGQKGALYNLVNNTQMDEQSQQAFRDQLSDHLRSIQETEAHLRKVQEDLYKMRKISG